MTREPARRSPTSPARFILIDGRGRLVDYAISLESAQALMEKAVGLVAAPA